MRTTTLICIVLLTWGFRRHASANDEAQDVWAIVATRQNAAADLADLMTVSLSSVDHVQLVERERVSDAVQELALASRVDVNDAQTLQLGEFVSADVVVLVEEISGVASRAFRVRAVECRTGVRHLDHLVSGSVDEAAKALSRVLLRVQARVRTDDAARHYVGVLGITSIEPGTLLIPVANSLSVLLEQDLQRHDSVFVLERDQLQRLRQEENLTGRELSLRAASVQIGGTVRRIEEGCELTLKLHHLNGSPGEDFTLRVKSQNPAEIRSQLTQAVLSRLADKLPPAPSTGASDLLDELEQIRLRRDWLAPNRRFEEAVRLAETAAALSSTESDLFRNYVIHRSYGLWSLGLRQKDFDTGLPLVVRAHEIQDQLTTIRARDPKFEGPLPFDFLPHAHLPNDEHLSRRLPLKAAMDRIRLARYEHVYQLRKQRGEPTLPLVIMKLSWCTYFCDSPERFSAMVLPLLEEAADGFNEAKLSPEEKSEMEWQFFRAISNQSINILNQRTNRRFPYPDYERYWNPQDVQPFFAHLATHERLELRIVGHHGLCRLPGEVGIKSALEVIRLQAQLAREATEHPFPLLTLSSRALERLAGTPRYEVAFNEVFGTLDRPSHPDVVVKLGFWVFNPLLNRAPQEKKRDWALQIRALMESKLGEQIPPDQLRSKLRSLATYVGDRPQPVPHVVRPRQPVRSVVSGEGAWQQYRRTPLVVGPDRRPERRAQQLIQLTYAGFDSGGSIDDRTNLLLLWARPQRRSAISRYSLTDGKYLIIGDVPGAGIPRIPRRMLLASSGNHFFVVTANGGLVEWSDGKSRRLDEAAGGPGQEILDLAWFNNALFVSTRGSLQKYDPETRQFETLMSSLSVDGQHALDGGTPWQMQGLTVDREHRKMWMTITSIDEQRRGLWRFHVEKSGKLSFDRIATFDEFHCSQVSRAGKWLYFNRNGVWGRVHRETDRIEPLPQYEPIVPARAVGLVHGRFAVTGDHIVLAGHKLLYTPDGKTHSYDDRVNWSSVLPLDDGFILASHTSYLLPGRQLWRFDWSRDSPSSSADDTSR